ncbi:unnamed protein product [Nezara viridula]|uniref:Uncharacterized protein n=1 Tax=Nezara viridula TaxID=85310 RepID=A0A9P0HE08_NEZVI|nr:unnamed protein product [Nezara viridula]
MIWRQDLHNCTNWLQVTWVSGKRITGYSIFWEGGECLKMAEADSRRGFNGSRPPPASGEPALAEEAATGSHSSSALWLIALILLYFS